MYYWKIDRRKAHQVRKQYQSFLHFVKGYFAACGDENRRVSIACPQKAEVRDIEAAIRRIPTAPPEEYLGLLAQVLAPGDRYVPLEDTLALINWLINRTHSTEVLVQVPLAPGVVRTFCPYEAWAKPGRKPGQCPFTEWTKPET